MESIGSLPGASASQQETLFREVVGGLGQGTRRGPGVNGFSSGEVESSVKLFDPFSGEEISERSYLVKLQDIYNRRNPHAPIGENDDEVSTD